jgi:organic hydroperoxide reductase OsmC/OhrA
MSEYVATVRWQRGDRSFASDQYSRGHEWVFDGGVTVPASASPDIVPVPLSVAENVDPEEAFVASLASCHMLFFLDIASRSGFTVDAYTDTAGGTLGKNAAGRTAMTRIVLRPSVVWSGDNIPSPEKIEKMHHRAHELCFIANSLTTEVMMEIVA